MAGLIDINIFYGVLGALLVSFMLNFYFFMTITKSVPEMKQFMKSSRKRRPIVFSWDTFNRWIPVCPEREGDDGEYNTYDMGKNNGVKFVPDPKHICHSEYGRKIINYYQKGTTAMTAVQAKALQDMRERMEASGMMWNKTNIDAILIATDEDFKELYEPEEVEQAKALREELKHTVVEDGPFSFAILSDFVTAILGETASGLEEYKSIARAKATDDAGTTGNDVLKSYFPYLIIVFVAATIAIVVYKMANAA